MSTRIGPSRVKSSTSTPRRDQSNDGRAHAGDTSSDYNAAPGVEANLLLRALPAATYARLAPHLEQLDMREHDVLWESRAPIKWVYFPRTLVASLLVPVDSELPVEAATVGREGMVGVPVVLGARSTSMKAIVQVAGEAVRISTAAFRDALAHDRGLLSRLLVYVHGLEEQIAQSVACVARHRLEERCARWLLMTHDRVGRDEFVLLQTFLASMLGVHRPRVTVAAGILQKAGFIRYQRGKISIVDRAGLEGAACECYGVLRVKDDQVLKRGAA